MHRYRWPIVVSILILLDGCGRSPAPAAVALPAGWQSIHQGNLLFALPPDWQSLNAEDSDFESALNDLMSANPRLASVGEQTRAALRSGNVKLMAFDLAAADALPNFTTNLSVGNQALTQPTSLQAVTDANARQLQASGFGDIQRSTFALAGETSARLSSTYHITAADGTALPLALDQFILLRPTQQYIFTFTTTTDQRARMTPVFEQIMGTLRIQ